MIGVCGPGEIRLVAGVTCGRRCRVVVVGMALYAGQRCMHSSQWIVGVGRVIEGDSGPVAGVMTGVAGGREGCCDMAGIGCSCEIRLVTSIAVGGKRCVVVIGMALRTRHSSMRAGQRKDRRMIEA